MKGNLVHSYITGFKFDNIYGGKSDQDKNFLQSFGFDFRLFAADWPAMAEAYEQARMWQTLNNDHRITDIVVNEMFPAEDYFKE